MSRSILTISLRRTALRWWCLLGAALLIGGRPAPTEEAALRLPGHIPPLVKQSLKIGHVKAGETIRLSLVLPLRDPAGLKTLLKRLYMPNDLLYGHYLTAPQFTEQFGPTQADYDVVSAWVKSQGLKITRVHPNRLLLNVSGSAHTVEQAFRVQLLQFRSPNGRVFRAPDVDPTLPASVAERVMGVLGLDTATQWHRAGRAGHRGALGGQFSGGLTPSNIRKAYNLDGLPRYGAGQVLGLVEFDGYTESDITAYENAYNLNHVPLTNVLIDDFSGIPGDGPGPGEVTLDIELMVALAPSASQIIVYETSNDWYEMLNRIATDNLAKQISISWNTTEDRPGIAPRAEDMIFQQMAAQGQSVYAASGDCGAYGDADNQTGCFGGTVSLIDPASQPYLTGVGGTKLSTTNGAWSSEVVWHNGNAGGGGGISTVWTIPDYQQGLGTAANRGSQTMRMVPDVALNSDSDPGYAIYYNGHWVIYGGTSAAAPLWAAFTALVNEGRHLVGTAPLGFANPALYAIGRGTHYGANFHDITVGNNRYFPATSGYDLATGWGSLIGDSLYYELGGATTLYVDHAYTGSIQQGTADAPYKTVTQAVNADGSSRATAIFVRANRYNEAFPSGISKRIKFWNWGNSGIVHIGSP